MWEKKNFESIFNDSAKKILQKSWQITFLKQKKKKKNIHSGRKERGGGCEFLTFEIFKEISIRWTRIGIFPLELPAILLMSSNVDDGIYDAEDTKENNSKYHAF